MTDAKPDVGALVEELRRRALPDPHDEREVRHADVFTRCRTALLALQAEVARLTQERDAYLAELRGPVKNGAVQKLGKALTRILDSDAWNGIEPLLNSAQAERDRLTQENELLAGEWKRECDDADRLLSAIGLYPAQYRTEGGSLMVMKVANAIKEARRDEQ